VTFVPMQSGLTHSEFVKLSVLGPPEGQKSYLADAAKRPGKVFLHKLSE